MKSGIVLSRLHGQSGRVIFDAAAGRVDSPAPQTEQNSTGNLCEFNGRTFALYVEDATLYFQWNAQRWDITAPGLRVTYQHHIANKTTLFAVGDQAITYEAWWADDPLFNMFIPERDQEEDYLGYVFWIWKNRDMQEALVAAWNRNVYR